MLYSIRKSKADIIDSTIENVIILQLLSNEDGPIPDHMDYGLIKRTL